MKWSRVIIYIALIALALLILVPLGVVVLNSLRSSQEITSTSMIGWPRQLTFANYGQAWNKFCMAEHCWGIEPYMLNSLTLVIPATILSTMLGCRWPPPLRPRSRPAALEGLAAAVLAGIRNKACPAC